ncbi:MAG: MraY family glycosyltransferase [Candidatus Uhrbacteria bacterium]|nr:MraY family glycosyltransferase [Candidatus Uhrbacteria bacterium]
MMWIWIVLAGAFSWGLAFLTRALARWSGALDQPTGGRKIHAKPIPLLGGVGIGFVIMGALFLATQMPDLLEGGRTLPTQFSGFLIGISLILFIGVLDDYFGLPVWLRFFAYAVACVVVIATGTRIEQVTRWIGHGGYSLIWWQWAWLKFPADIITLVWLLGVTFATKFFDGLDGLVTGQTVIATLLIAGLALSHAYSQPEIAVLALMIGAAFLGFLPHNFYPAKQFLGEAGSALAGFTLGFLAIVSGAKVATALMALGLPLADASLVVFGRLIRGTSPFRGDDTHLHFKLLKAGLSQRKVVMILWTIALLFGLAAFGVQTRGKVLLLIVLAGLTILLPFLVRVMQRSRIPKV